ncbi:unnamed protein product [Lymnaea stagnalis]|uniref:BED-type domain-containing protein n=1 Tax=Lymnaea stagnalis TaxID=6523 RepID=A0AAV2H6Z7_LYMST
MSQSSRQVSKIWKYFTINSVDASKANCNICKEKYSRGGKDPRNYGTKIFINHLQSQHPAEYNEYATLTENEKKRKSKDDSGTSTGKRGIRKQTTLFPLTEKSATLNTNHTRQIVITTSIGRMLASNTLPFSFVETSAFKELLHVLEPRYTVPSRQTFSRSVIPDMYYKARTILEREISKANLLSFTTDVWTTVNNLNAFLSFTVHWIDESWHRKFAFLQLRQMEGRQTGEVIATEVMSILEDWQIQGSRCGVLVHDNGASMVKAARLASLNDLACYINTIQLVVNDGLKAQWAVMDTIAAARLIVGHFHYSTIATEALKAIQRTLNCDTSPHPQHRLIQDVATRWTSTFYMLERLLEQKRAITLYCQNVEMTNLTATQWNICDHLIKTLRPFEEETKKASLACSSAGMIIPGIRLLQRFLERPANPGDDAGIQPMRTEMLKSWKTRFGGFEQNKVCAIATVLEPTYKLFFFTTDEAKSTAIKWLLEEAISQRLNQLQPEKKHQPSDVVVTTSMAPAASQVSSLDAYWQEFLPAQTTTTPDSDESICQREIDSYLSDPLYPRQTPPEDATIYWKANAARFPILALCAQKYLATPPSIVDSECVFSSAGLICDDHRSSISSKKTEMLLFLKMNMTLLDTGI